MKKFFHAGLCGAIGWTSLLACQSESENPNGEENNPGGSASATGGSSTDPMGNTGGGINGSGGNASSGGASPNPPEVGPGVDDSWFEEGNVAQENLALALDGNDNNTRSGLGLFEAEWALEAWIKGNDTQWKEREVVFSGGEYANDIRRADFYPLVLEDGRLHSDEAGLSSDVVLDDAWHHVAVSCDGERTTLFLDGQEVDSADSASPIIPAAVGSSFREGDTFGGLIDEVRIWETSLDEALIGQWMNRPLEASHPHFSQLRGYYNFDDPEPEYAVNLVGANPLPYHLILDRVDYESTVPVATRAPNNNPSFQVPAGKSQLLSATALYSEWDGDRGTEDDIAKLRLVVQPGTGRHALWELSLDLSASTDLNDIEAVHVYYAGASANSGVREELFGSGQPPSERMTFHVSADQEQQLAAGVNYFLVTFDVAPDAKLGNVLDATVSSFHVQSTLVSPAGEHSNVAKRVTADSSSDPQVYRVLAWNIWHGGNHLPGTGPQVVEDIIEASRADAVLMQESYGSQESIAQGLGFELTTPSGGANLSILTRDAATEIDSPGEVSSFESIGVRTSTSSDHPVMLYSWWLRYAYRPEYTNSWPNPGQDPQVWIDEDKILSTVDATDNITHHVNPAQPDRGVPVIVGGDFNSCSHLDWTAEAASIHAGYGPVDFPTSLYMQQHDFVDSFREANPDEVLYPGGTWAQKLGFVDSRIDFIYHRGTGVTTMASKTIRQPHEIDYIWPGDHAAVLSTLVLAQ